MLASQLEADGDASADEVDRGKKKVEELVAEGVKHVDSDDRAQRKGHPRSLKLGQGDAAPSRYACDALA